MTNEAKLETAAATNRGLIFLLAKAELTLLLSIALGVIFSGLLVFSLPALHPSWEIAAHVKSCSLTVDNSLAEWARAQRLYGVEVEISKTPEAIPPENSGQTYRVFYSNLGLFDLIRVWIAPDADRPIPRVLSTQCQPERFDFGRIQTLVPTRTLFVIGWCSAILMLVLVRGSKGKQRPESSEKFATGFYLRWVCAGLLMAALIELICIQIANFGGINPAPYSTDFLLVDERVDWVLIFFVSLVAPVCEELLFRGWLLQNFVSAKATVLGAVTISISFSAMHWTGSNLGSSGALYHTIVFLMSIALCQAFVRTRTVRAPACMHVANNVFMVAIALVAR